jgi:hypothetical protein
MRSISRTRLNAEIFVQERDDVLYPFSKRPLTPHFAHLLSSMCFAPIPCAQEVRKPLPCEPPRLCRPGKGLMAMSRRLSSERFPEPSLHRSRPRRSRWRLAVSRSVRTGVAARFLRGSGRFAAGPFGDDCVVESSDPHAPACPCGDRYASRGEGSSNPACRSDGRFETTDKVASAYGTSKSGSLALPVSGAGHPVTARTQRSLLGGPEGAMFRVGIACRFRPRNPGRAP